MEVVIFFVAAITYALLCRWVAEIARAKGHSYWLFALGSFFFTPLLGGIAASIAPDRARASNDRA